MKDFGVRFLVNDQKRLEQLQCLWAEIKHDKDADSFREDAGWLRFVPDEVKPRFHWPSDVERQRWPAVRDSTPIAISSPSEQIGASWDFFSVIESFETGEYTLLECERTNSLDIAEMKIDPLAYPYGGIGPLIALVEAFGFTVLGVNEYGKYLDRETLNGVGSND